jgi:hypothetical protein
MRVAVRVAGYSRVSLLGALISELLLAVGYLHTRSIREHSASQGTLRASQRLAFSACRAHLPRRDLGAGPAKKGGLSARAGLRSAFDVVASLI